MKCNVGKKDRIIFLVFGLLIFTFGFIFHSWWGLIGLIPVIVAASGRCAVFYLFKIDTARKDIISK